MARRVEVRCSTRRAARTTDCHEQWHAVQVARLMLVSNTEAGHARRAGKGKHAPAILRRGVGAHSPAGSELRPGSTVFGIELELLPFLCCRGSGNRRNRPPVGMGVATRGPARSATPTVQNKIVHLIGACQLHTSRNGVPPAGVSCLPNGGENRYPCRSLGACNRLPADVRV